jgi:hypothetical protein
MQDAVWSVGAGKARANNSEHLTYCCKLQEQCRLLASCFCSLTFSSFNTQVRVPCDKGGVLAGQLSVRIRLARVQQEMRGLFPPSPGLGSS